MTLYMPGKCSTTDSHISSLEVVFLFVCFLFLYAWVFCLYVCLFSVCLQYLEASDPLGLGLDSCALPCEWGIESGFS